MIGADGVHSRIRNALFGEMPARFTGLLAWRGLVPMERLPERLRRLVGTNWVGPGGHVVHYPVRSGTLLNFVGTAERSDWQVESWTERGTTEEALNDFKGWNADVETIIRNIEAPFKWALLGREPLAQWTKGRVTLLGDAAHPTLPMMAQGANMAIEDGVVLARSFAAHADIARSLAAYEQARRERTSRLVRAANDNAARFHNPALGDASGAARYVDSEWQEAEGQAALRLGVRIRSGAYRGLSRNASAPEERDQSRDRLVRLLVDQPMAGSLDHHAFDIVRDHLALLDQEIAGRLLAGEHQHRHLQLGLGEFGKILGVLRKARKTSKPARMPSLRAYSFV